MFLKRLLPNLNNVFVPTFTHKPRAFWKWLNSIFNKVDYKRIQDVGADRAAAEWLLRCGASVRWKCKDEWLSDYNALQKQCTDQNLIEEIDATESCVMHIGFFYLSGLKHLKKIKFCKCIYLEDTCIHMLSVTKNSLLQLEIISCGNISDKGLHSITELKKLKSLYLSDLPGVEDKEGCVKILKTNLPQCDICYS